MTFEHALRPVSRKREALLSTSCIFRACYTHMHQTNHLKLEDIYTITLAQGVTIDLEKDLWRGLVSIYDIYDAFTVQA